MSEIPNDIYAIILAAGGSSRFGSTKQLAVWENDYLINHVLKTVVEIFDQNIAVVLGANADQIQNKVEQQKKFQQLIFLISHDWQKGLSSSIKVGVINLPKNAKAAMIFLADQPLIETGSIKKMIRLYQQNSNQIIASQYHDSPGVPAIFPVTKFTDLISLKGDIGARNLLKKQRSEILTVDFSKQIIDIDTPHDLQKLKR